jgi:hypothetical protein
MGRRLRRLSGRRSGEVLNAGAGREQAQPAVRFPGVTLPRRWNQRRAVLVLALIAGLFAMHGLSGTALAAPAHWGMTAAMGMDGAAGRPADGVRPAIPASNMPHHGPAANGHHPCVAAPASGAPVGPLTGAAPAPLSQPRRGREAAPAGARADRAPPDLHGLCISRT